MIPEPNIETEIIYAITHTLPMETLLHLEIPSVIAISGKMGTGKDTVYKILEVIAKMKGETIKNFKFARVLKEIVSIIEQTSIQDLEYQRVKSRTLSKIINGGVIRDSLVYFGEKIRELNPDFFAERLIADIASSGTNINVITDLRFKNELEFVNNQVILRINRANIPISTDLSETDLDDYPFENVIWNNSTITDLVRDIIIFLNELNSKDTM